MEVKLNAQGEVVINVTNGESGAALELLKALRAEQEGKKVSEIRSKSMTEAAEKYGKLNGVQYRTWEYLVANDNPEGIHVSQVARAFGVSNAAANTRCLTLEKLGYAKRVHKGYYRALTPEDG